MTEQERPEGAPLTAAGLAAPRTAKLSFERVPLPSLDRFLPARPAPFVAAALCIAVASWVAGFLLAADKDHFLQTREWQIQPLYLATHLLILRLFVTAYVRNFLEGCGYLTIAPGVAERRISTVLGPIGIVCALAFAAWFVWSDCIVYLRSAKYVTDELPQGPGGTLGPADALLAVIWAVEWIVNAYVWVVILGFLGLTMRVLKAYRFTQDVDVVLGERHYRPFLLMSAQGASIVVVFSVVSAIYVWYAEGETTDYLGLWITAGLLILCFVPPWLRLKNGIARLARIEADRLNREIQTDWRVVTTKASVVPTETESVSKRLNLLLVMARASHLERLIRDFGRNEGQAILLRLLAPISTAAWKLFHPG